MIGSRFESVIFDAHAMGVSDHVRRIAMELEDALVTNISGSRELSLALTNLEEAVMWANKALKHDVEFREVMNGERAVEAGSET